MGVTHKLKQLHRDRGLRGLFIFLCSRLVRTQVHIVFVCETGETHAAKEAVHWRPEEKVFEIANAHDIRTLNQDCGLPPGLDAYFSAVRDGSAIGIFVLSGGKLAHWAFIMKKSRTLCYLGFNGTETALLGSAFTTQEARGRGLQTRSVAHRINVASRYGYRIVVSEVAPENEFSARALISGGMQRHDYLRIWVICNRLVIRLPSKARPRGSVGYCPS